MNRFWWPDIAEEMGLNAAGFKYAAPVAGCTLLTDVITAALPTAKATIWLARYNTSSSDPILIEAAQHLADCGLENAVLTRRAEYVAGRQLAALALGKPNLSAPWLARREDGSAAWPDSVNGSISHSYGIVAVLTGQRGFRIGVDVEKIATLNAVQAIRRQTMTRREHAALVRTGEILDPVLATLVFSAKETVFKALSPEAGESIRFAAAECLFPVRPDSIQLRLSVNLSGELRAGTIFWVRYLVLRNFVLTFLADLTDRSE